MQTLAPSSDISFTPSVKRAQERRGGTPAYRHIEAHGGWRTDITPDLAAYLAARDSVYFATASAAGQPYIQHRGGPPGFLHVLDAHTIGFADYAGNRQYITLGNLAENPQAQLFAMDYAERRRVKLWGTARVVDDDPALLARLMPEGYKARPERAILFTVAAWDTNCPKHIPQKFDAADVAVAVERLQSRIAALEAENAAMRAAAAKPAPTPARG